jgi:hypothetical protein
MLLHTVHTVDYHHKLLLLLPILLAVASAGVCVVAVQCGFRHTMVKKQQNNSFGRF